jgi:hypothetical protein
LLEQLAIIKKDGAGAVDEELSLKCLMECCLDFTNEITELGVRVISTTKFHKEMAGKGIEYLWGVSKS